MIEHVRRPPRPPRRRPRWCCRSGYRPDAFLDAYPDGVLRRGRAALRRRARAARHRRRDPLRRPRRRHRRALPRGQRRRAHRPRRRRSWSAFHAAHGAEGTIAPAPRSTTRRATASCPPTTTGGCRRSSRSRRRGEAPTDLINAGTYVLEPSVLERIPDGRKVSIERETFPAMVADGSALRPGRRRLLDRRRHARDLPAGPARPRRRRAGRAAGRP